MKPNRLLLALLIFARFCLFWQYASREIIWAYAGGYDQTSYLAVGYDLTQNAQRDGPFTAIGQYLHHSHPTGFMLPLQWNIF